MPAKDALASYCAELLSGLGTRVKRMLAGKQGDGRR